MIKQLMDWKTFGGAIVLLLLASLTLIIFPEQG